MADLQAAAVLSGPEHAYRIEGVLGRGGFGVTYLARREGDGLQVALKQLHVSRLEEHKSLELFQREIAVLRRLSHPRIPDYVDDFVAEGLVLVQEYVEGHDLSRVVQGEVEMDEGGLVSWMAQVLEVLDYLHHLTPPVVHRDISPKNILLRPDATAYVVDFGTVTVGLPGTLASTSAGTFGYAPMEQFVSRAFPASDLYGLGMTCLAVASGREPSDMPFDGIRVDVRGMTALDARLTLLLERMTEPDPERRLGDARVALEQLRPLLARYAAGRGVTAAAMQRVAERHRDERAPTARAGIAADDLLPSERIREAGARIARLAGSALGIPPLEAELGYTSSAALSPDGTVVVLEGHVVDLGRMTCSAHLPGFQAEVASPAGEVLVGSSGVVLERRDAGYARVGSLEAAGAALANAGGKDASCMSPDGRSLAVVDQGGDVLLFDLRARRLAQRIKAGDPSYNAVVYSADGRVLACSAWDRAHLLDSGGGETVVDGCVALAFAPDGQRAAVVRKERRLSGSRNYRERAVHIGPVEAVVAGEKAPDAGDLAAAGVVRVPLPHTYGGLTRRPLPRTWTHLRFSPDGRWLALLSDDQVWVLDAEAGEVVLRLADPGRPGGKISSVEGIAFSADGARLLVACDVHYNRFMERGRRCVALWAVPSGRYLGALTLPDDEPKAPVAVAASGFYGPLPTDDGAPAAPDPERPWLRPEVARGALLGQPADALLDDTDRARLADLEARWAFFSDLRDAGQVDPEAGLPKLVEATRGLTHVLDLVVRRARQAQREMPTFGGGGGGGSVALTSDQVVAAAEAMARTPAEELAQLHEELLREAEASEQARAREEAASLAHPAPRASSRAAGLLEVVGPRTVVVLLSTLAVVLSLLVLSLLLW